MKCAYLLYYESSNRFVSNSENGMNAADSSGLIFLLRTNSVPIYLLRVR